MNKGLLLSLRKFRTRENIDPLENFITEAFAWILEEHNDFSKFFLEKIEERVEEIPFDLQKDSYTWDTQYNLNGKRPDMICHCKNKNSAVIFEHKVWSSLHNNQIDNYRDKKFNTFDDYKIVLITASKGQHTQKPDLALCWSKVYEWIEEWIDDKKENVSFIFDDFLELLKSEGLAPTDPLSIDSILYYYQAMELKNAIRNIINNVIELEKKEQELCKIIGNDEIEIKFCDKWGRIGIGVLNSWRPGIFIGILVDGNDHKTKPIDKSRGPDFCLILDFDDDLHDKYSNNEYYIKLVEDLKKNINNYKIYEHLQDSDIKSKNKWHPIHIRRPMIELFRDKTKINEQVDIFYKETLKLLKLVVNNNNFKELRKKYKV